LPVHATHRPRYHQNADEHAVPHQLAVIVTYLLVAETVAVETDRSLERDDLLVLTEPSHLAGLRQIETYALTVGHKFLHPIRTFRLVAGVIDRDLDRYLATSTDDHDLPVDAPPVLPPAARHIVATGR
jgi:hypothetical protein